MVNWSNYEHFSREEFDSKGVGDEGTGDNMHDAFISKLHQARVLANIPFKINSGYRSPQHNASVGGVPNSSHTKGWAADIAVTSTQNRFLIINSLLSVGFNRIGVYKTFCHVDLDPDKPKNVIWYK